MQTSKILYWGAQFGGWLSYGTLIFLATYADNPDKLNANFFISISLFLTLGIVITHIMRTFFIRWKFLELKLAPLIPRILIFSIIAAGMMAFFNNFITYFIEKDFSRPFTSINFLIDILSLSILITLWNAIYFTYHFFRKTITQEMHVLQMQASQNEIELKSLRSQINPHFLFNSLNSIRALIDIEPKVAKEGITTLSNLLRKSLVQGKNAFIPLHEEIDLVKNYLDLEKIRFEERLQITWKMDDGLEQFQIPPFLIHTQIENAIKHGISKLIKGGLIAIQITQHKTNGIRIEIINSGRILESQSETAIGIENTKRRLYLQYKDNASFNLYDGDGVVHCVIEIESQN
jgi:sensor histidine kinase YesM